jgi:hypothetical protein
MTQPKINGSTWKKVIYAHDCEACDMCGDPVCPICEDHYADCDCPGPHQDDEYNYQEIKGVLYASAIEQNTE